MCQCCDGALGHSNIWHPQPGHCVQCGAECDCGAMDVPLFLLLVGITICDCLGPKFLFLPLMCGGARQKGFWDSVAHQSEYYYSACCIALLASFGS